MAVHKCLKEEKFTRIFEILSDINTEIFGKDGIVRTVPRLEGKIDNLCETVGLLSTNVSALMKYQAGENGVKIYKDKQKLSARQWTGIIISAILSVAGIIVAFILKA